MSSIVLRNIRMNDLEERPIIWKNPVAAGLTSINPAPALTAIVVYDAVKDKPIAPATKGMVIVL